MSDVHHTSEWTFSSHISRLSLPLVFDWLQYAKPGGMQGRPGARLDFL